MSSNIAKHMGTTRKEGPDIFRAAREDDLYELRAALRDGQSLRVARLETGLTPIHVAAIRGSVNFLRVAMEHEPQAAWIQDVQLRLPFAHAAVRKDRQSMAYLHNAMYPEATIPVPESQY
jgi:hypothetical protein